MPRSKELSSRALPISVRYVSLDGRRKTSNRTRGTFIGSRTHEQGEGGDLDRKYPHDRVEGFVVSHECQLELRRALYSRCGAQRELYRRAGMFVHLTADDLAHIAALSMRAISLDRLFQCCLEWPTRLPR